MTFTDVSNDIYNINHVGMAVRSLPETALRYEAMGFQLTPYSPHSAAWKPGDPVQALSSGNRCVMFGDNYLEILGNEDAQRPAARITSFLKRHEGGHIVCFDCKDVDKVDARLRKAGVKTSGNIPLQREVDTPDGIKTAKFERVQFDPQDTPEGYIQAAKHLTPEYIYQPRYIVHPNGCNRLTGVILIASDLSAVLKRYRAYLLDEPKICDGTARFTLSHDTHLTWVDVAHVHQHLPGTLWPPLPGIAAVSFQTPHLNDLRTRLTNQSIPIIEHDGNIIVPAEKAFGLALIFHSDTRG